MNKFDETRKRPAYSYKTQKASNSLPFWAKAKTDKHSNYQSIVSDLIEPLEDLIYHAQAVHAHQYAHAYQTDDSRYLYRYISEDFLKLQRENRVSYVEPASVKISENFGEYFLTKCPYPSLGDLNNRLPLYLKSATTKALPYEILNADEENKEYLIFVKETCYLGLGLNKQTEGVTLPEDFFLIEDFKARYSLIYLRNYFKKPIQAIRVLPNIYHMFKTPVTPGFYYINFDLLNSSQLDDYTVTIYGNESFPEDKQIYYDTYIEPDFSIDSYMEITDGYLNIISKDFDGSRDAQTLENYVLLDENDESFYCSTWMRKEMLLYALSEGDGEKLYIYNLYPEGNSYVYEDNDRYILDLQCDKIDYRTGDTVQIETRSTGMLNNFKINGLRLKVENKESNETFYINKNGMVLPESSPYTWRNYEESASSPGHQIRWNFTLENIGSYKITCEALVDNKEVITAGVKLILVNYKVPYRVITLDDDYSGWTLGIDPNGNLELVNAQAETRKTLKFEKDGYFFDANEGILWTNIEVPQLIVEY